jgi:hypothetical protein
MLALGKESEELNDRSCRSGLLAQWIETTPVKHGVVSILMG